jgi:hypothetical protein
MKSKRKQHRNNFVRGVRAETEINCYSRCLGWVLGRDREQAARLIRAQIDQSRKALEAVAAKRGALVTS